MKRICTIQNKTIDPKFEIGAIAYYRSENSLFPGIVAERSLKDNGIAYKVYIASGFVTYPAHDLMTGWEPEFPDLSEI